MRHIFEIFSEFETFLYAPLAVFPQSAIKDEGGTHMKTRERMKLAI